MAKSEAWRKGHSTAIFVAILFCLSPAVFGQAHPQLPAVRVPFVGCKSDGQAGPVEAPSGRRKMIRIDPRAAQTVAYYESAVAPAAIGPRGWFCFGVYGSGGSALFIEPERVNKSSLFPSRDIKGPFIEFRYIDGDTSGRFEVAQVIARVFPKYRGFVERLIDTNDLSASEITYGPYPADKLTYRSDRVVEFLTPPNSEGLSAIGLMKPNNEAIEGVAILQGPAPDLLLLSVRLPPGMDQITAAIIQQVEREADKPAR